MSRSPASVAGTYETASTAKQTDLSSSLDLGALPPIFALAAHLETDDLHAVEDNVTKYGGHLTYDPREGRIFVGKIAHKRRAALELRALGLRTVEVVQGQALHENGEKLPSKKRRRETAPENHPSESATADPGAESATDSEPDEAAKDHIAETSRPLSSLSVVGADHDSVWLSEGRVIVVGLEWLQDSLSAAAPQPLLNYKIYYGELVPESPEIGKPIHSSHITGTELPATPTKRMVGADILARAKEEVGSDRSPPSAKTYSSTTQSAKYQHKRRRTNAPQPPRLARQTTSDYDSDHKAALPPMPDWVQRRSTYSCERSTPADGPNDAFVRELKQIRLARTLLGDEIGVRAYSTAIAAIAAYPHALADEREVLRLPGCDAKIAALWAEFDGSGGAGVRAARDAETDPHMQALRLFYDVWGVGAQTARAFYNRGWRDLDDVVEHGWDTLSRVQQIGVKYFDEFKAGIPRAEVEAIAATVHEHAARVREPSGVRTVIVGGHRRGKAVSGDVDVIVSHTDEQQTLHIVQDVVRSLADAGWVTHELSVSLQGTRRGQATLPFRRGGGGHGFDTLDKALVVWQDPEWPGRAEAPPDAKNPNVHRRVDIIIAPWSKVGCAVLGWSAGTTFERDLRRYAKHKKGWKFDSSGIRDRMSGLEVDLESVGGVCKTPEEAEKKVFAGLGLVYREPWERCTG